MSLYYNNDNYELTEIDDNLIEQWRVNNNPKYNYYILVPPKPSENAIWNNGSWIIPEPVTPQTVSARQIRLWLIQHGFQLSQIESSINAIEDTMIRETVKIEWEYAPYIERNHPWLVPLAQSLGLNENQIDQAFIEASQI